MNLYNPPRFKSEDSQEVFDFIAKNPFATLVTSTNEKFFISHVPLVAEQDNSSIILIGHFARANPHWQLLKNATAIFHGPHTYITPKWYREDDVPTWNYLVAHLSGKVELIEDEKGVLDCLKLLSKHAETLWPSGWDFSVPEDLRGLALTKHIVGFKIHVSEVSFKKKLSQNRTPEDRSGVIKGLENRKDEFSRAILTEMKKST